MPFPQTERLAAKSAIEIDIKLQQMSALPCETKRLAAETITEETPDFTVNERHTRLAAEITEEMPGLNVTEQDMGNSRLFSCHCLFFSSLPSKSCCINPMQTWLHWIHQCYASFQTKGNGSRKLEESKTEDCLSMWSCEDC